MFFIESDSDCLLLGGWQTYQVWNQYCNYSNFNWTHFSAGKYFSTVPETTLKIGRYPFKGHLYCHILSTSQKLLTIIFRGPGIILFSLENLKNSLLIAVIKMPQDLSITEQAQH